MDISTVKAPREINIKISKQQPRIIVDELTGMKWSDLFQTKDRMIEPTCEKWGKWNQHGKAVKFVRMDNLGENNLL